MAKKTSKKVTKKVTKKTTEAPVNTQPERDETAFEKAHMGKNLQPLDEKTFPSLVTMMDEGVQKELSHEVKVWNERLFTASPYQGGELDRFPLSPSQIGKCALALGRNLSHYLGIWSYPRNDDYITPRTKRIFNRGHLLEDALITDFEKNTRLKVLKRQRRVRLPFNLAGGKRVIEGNIDVEYIDEETGTVILSDKKSKGAFYSAGFNDSISETFQGYRQTGFVSEFAPNSFLISDALGFFNVISLDDFIVDYLLQLNSYAFSTDVETGEQLRFDFCSLYYENKNSCQNYEIRWKPHPGLMQFAQEKFEYVYNNVRQAAMNHKQTPEVPFEDILMNLIPKEFSLGTARCKLCDHKDLCYGTFDPSTKPATHFMGTLDPDLDKKLIGAISQEQLTERIREDVLQAMAQQDATHIETSTGICYERKWYKTDKEYKLKQVRKPL